MSKTAVALPKTTKDITVLDHDYIVKFPNNGQFIEIEVMKAHMTRDAYNTIASGNSVSSMQARFTVDMIAFFSVCCPKLRTDLKVDSFSELDMLTSKDILNVYLKEVLPWLSEWEMVLNAADEVSDES